MLEGEPGQTPAQPGSNAGTCKSGLAFEQAADNTVSCSLQFLWAFFPSPFKAFDY